MSLPEFAVYLTAAFGALAGLWFVGRKYGVLGLLIVSSPIHRLSWDIGFSLKLLYIVTAGAIVMKLWRAQGDPFVVRTNRFFRLCLWFLAAVALAAMVNGITTTSIRHLIVFGLVFAACYVVQGELRSRGDVARLIDVYLLTGLLLGVSGIALYVQYLVAPGLSVPGGVLDGVTYDPERTWTVPLLQSVDVGSNGYSLSLLPFLFVAMGEMTRGGSERRRYAGFVFGLLVVNLLLTFSRGGVVAFLATAIVGLFAQKGQPKLKFAVIVLAIGMAPFASRAADLYREYSYLKGSFSGEDTTLLSGRLVLAEKALAVTAQNPFFGVGEGNVSGARYLGKQVHNTYLELLAEGGTITFGMGMVLFGVFLKRVAHEGRRLLDTEAKSVYTSLVLGLGSILVALVATSALTMPLLWIQATAVFGMATVNRSERLAARAQTATASAAASAALRPLRG